MTTAEKLDPPTRLSRRLPWGLLDSGLSSLATFITGFLAVHYVSTPVLGVYALALSAFALSGAMTSVLSFMAIETAAVQQLPQDSRARAVRRSLPQGAGVSGVASLLAGAVTLAVPSSVSTGDKLQLAVACVAVSAVSPLQDHVRRMLHNSLDSLGAATVSIAQFVTVIAVTGGVLALGIQSQPAVPFGVLATANAVSLFFGLVRISHSPLHASTPALFVTLRRSFAFGGQLALSSLVVYASGLAAIAVVIAVAGADSAGEAEAARVLAQPITVLCVGVLSVLTPDLVRAATVGDRHRLRVLVARFLGFIGVLTLVWSLLAWRPHRWSPLADIAPGAYTVPGLLLITVPGQVVGYATGFGSTVAQATGRLRLYSVLAAETSVIGLVVTVIAARHGAWALALGSVIAGCLMLTGMLALTLRPPPRASDGTVLSAADNTGL